MPEQLPSLPKKRNKEPEKAVDISSELNRLNSRLRLIEDTVENLRSKLQLTSENMLSNDKDIRGDIKVTTSDIDELKMGLSDIKEKIIEMISTIKDYAKKEDVLTLKKYLDLWQPLNFVTREEVEKLIKEIIGEQSR